MTKKSKYPEHDKLLTVQEKSQAIGDFLTNSRGTLCVFRSEGNNGKNRYIWALGVTTRKYYGGKPILPDDVPSRFDFFNKDAVLNPEYEEWKEGYHPIPLPLEKILADYFNIDLAALQNEKDLMLAEVLHLQKQ